jgi:hypothetical protein
MQCRSILLCISEWRVRMIISIQAPITVAARSDTEIAGSNPIRGMDVCPRFFSMLFCACCRLPTVYKIHSSRLILMGTGQRTSYGRSSRIYKLRWARRNRNNECFFFSLSAYICILFHGYLLTNLRSWALPEKLPIVQPLRNFPAF